VVLIRAVASRIGPVSANHTSVHPTNLRVKDRAQKAAPRYGTKAPKG